MRIAANSVDEYYENIPEERKEAMNKLRQCINESIADGFEEALGYGMPAWVVPHSLYPDGYHCKPSEPLPFISIASQKNSINLYHMGIYATPSLLEWFVNEYPKHCSRKLDMGKSCIRFKKLEDIPYELIAELCTKMKAEEWIEIYESQIKK
jgi:uncharacterized protein YdhG (YjbR/CyaY superfamily)